MQLFFSTEHSFVSYNGGIYTETVGDYTHWTPYLDAFSSVCVIARVREVSSLPVSATRADGDCVTFFPLIDYAGPLAALVKLPRLLKQTKEVSGQEGVFFLRVPGAISTLVWIWLWLKGWPFAATVAGDPADSLKAVQATWARLLRPLAVCVLRAQCRTAACTLYVTQTFLQQRYPPGTDCSFFYSDVQLPSEFFERARVWRQDLAQSKVWPRSGGARLIFVGSLSQRYKGLHVLLQAMQQCIVQDTLLTLEVLGDGKYRSDYEQLAARLGLTELVKFQGHVAQGDSVLWRLCQSDLFVMPSLAEGLPRAMVEAMACGLPCIGSRVGGIPELLPEEDMVLPGDAEALAQKLSEVLADTERMRDMGRRNRQAAMAYRAELLDEKRRLFYRRIHEITSELSMRMTHQNG